LVYGQTFNHQVRTIMFEQAHDFIERFEAITGYTPYRWQVDVYERMLRNQFTDLKLPTGTGKTSVMVIWLLALVKRAEQSRSYGFPRRLAWVVDRRTVVDQATAQAEEIRDKLEEPSLAALKKALLGLSATCSGNSLAVSTLRGELADNGEWKKDPSKPAIMVGTVDMVGSRLLFSGYGDGRWHKPLHAGLLGTDVLLVLDEAHLSVPFSHLIRKVAELNRPESVGLPPFRFMFLSATLDADTGSAAIKLLGKEENIYLRKILRAPKKLILHDENEKQARLADRLVELALQVGEEKEGSRIVVYATDPKEVLEIRKKLSSKTSRSVIALTGTIRGYERDKLINHPDFQRFLSKKDKRDLTVYFVANSAAEVGIDMYADHMVCDLVAADRMIQRLGRVNRDGDGDAVVHVVKVKEKRKKKIEKPIQRTWEYLNSVSSDASPLTLLLNPPPRDAVEPRPPYPPLPYWILDSWALTTLTEWPSRPEVEAWLKGLEDSPPDVYFAWREDVDFLVKLGSQQIAEVIRNYPPLSREILRESEIDAKEKILALSDRVPNGKAVLLSYSGNVTWKGELHDLSDMVRGARLRLGYSTLLLSASCGGLNEGFFDPDCPDPATDVSAKKDERFYGRLSSEDGRFVWQFFSGAPKDLGEKEFSEKNQALRFVKERTGLRPYLTKAPDDEKDEWLAYFVREAHEGHALPAFRMALSEHQAKAEKYARLVGEKIGLPKEYVQALAEAAKNHDVGKDTPIWQRYAKNEGPEPLAKSDAYDDYRLLKGYRHELGSVLALHHETTELVMHLIASHHGYARPVYPEGAVDPVRPMESREEMERAPLRFAHLQKELGWWGLAYLESLLKSADSLASQVMDSD
jgi:CRISPR-associated endonuclease/helicase Cas3